MPLTSLKRTASTIQRNDGRRFLPHRKIKFCKPNLALPVVCLEKGGKIFILDDFVRSTWQKASPWKKVSPWQKLSPWQKVSPWQKLSPWKKMSLWKKASPWKKVSPRTIVYLVMHFSMKKDDFQNVYIFEKWTTILGGNAVTPLEKEKKKFLNKSHKDPWNLWHEWSQMPFISLQRIPNTTKRNDEPRLSLNKKMKSCEPNSASVFWKKGVGALFWWFR